MLLALVVGKGEAGGMHERRRVAVCRTGFVMVIFVGLLSKENLEPLLTN